MFDTDREAGLVTDGGLRRRHDTIRALAGVGDQDPTCEHGTVGCPGPEADASELPCAACFLGGARDE